MSYRMAGTETHGRWGTPLASTHTQQVAGMPEKSSAQGRGPIFKNPWGVVVGAVVGLIVGSGAVVAFTFSLFLRPIAMEFGWTRAQVSAGLTTFQLLAAIGTPFAGKLADIWGARRATFFFVASFGVFVAALALLPPQHTAFLLLYAAAGLASAGQAPPPYARAIASWFEEKRGLALGVGALGVGFGTTLMPQVARVFLSHYGWRGAYVGLGLVTFAVGFTAVGLWVFERPRAVATVTGSGASRLAELPEGFTLGEASKKPAFWYLTLTMFLVSCVTNGFVAHVGAMVSDRGESVKFAAFLLTLAGLMMIVGKLVAGVLLDRMHPPYVSAVLFLVAFPGLLLFNAGSTTTFPILGILFVGVSLGAMVPVENYLAATYFGLRQYGTIAGYFMGCLLLGASLGPWLMGASFDRTHSYHIAITGFCAALVVCALSVSQMGPAVFASMKRK